MNAHILFLNTGNKLPGIFEITHIGLRVEWDEETYVYIIHPAVSPSFTYRQTSVETRRWYLCQDVAVIISSCLSFI